MDNLKAITYLASKTESSVVRLGTIPNTYTSGDPKILFDGENTTSIKTYTHLASYTPAASDRVLLLRVGATYVILGKL